MSADKPLAQRLQEADQTIGYLITVGERRTLHLLLTEAADALKKRAPGEAYREVAEIYDPLARERRIAREEAEQNAAQDACAHHWLGDERGGPLKCTKCGYKLQSSKPPLTKEAAELLAEVFPKPKSHES